MIKSTIFIFLLLSFVSSVIQAQEIEINVHTKSEPKSALGIFFSSGKVVQQPNTSIERITPDIVVVKMPYDISGLPSASPFATAYLLTSDNEIIFGDVRLVSAADSSDSFWRIPVCVADSSRTKTQMPLPEQLNYLESLLQVRAKKREVAQKVVHRRLTQILSLIFAYEKVILESIYLPQLFGQLHVS